MPTWQDFLLSLLQDKQPQRILLRDASLRAWLQNQPTAVVAVDTLPADMAWLFWEDQDISPIARLRDRCPLLAVIVPSAEDRHFKTFISLGFERRFHSAEQGMSIFVHDIATYKSVPDWLNSKFWANPERWEP
jgi:hypothetical protein